MASYIDELVSICWSKVTRGSYFQDHIFADLIFTFISELENVLDLTTPLLEENQSQLLKSIISKSPNKRISKNELTDFLSQLVGDGLEEWILKRSKLTVYQLRQLCDQRFNRTSKSTIENQPPLPKKRYQFQTPPLTPQLPPSIPKSEPKSFKGYESYDHAHQRFERIGDHITTSSKTSWELRRKDEKIKELKMACFNYKQALEMLTGQNEEANIQLEAHLKRVEKQNEQIKTLSMKLKLNNSKYENVRIDTQSQTTIKLLLFKLPTLKQVLAIKEIANDRWKFRWYVFCLLLILIVSICITTVLQSFALLSHDIIQLVMRLRTNDNWYEVTNFQWWKAFSTLESTIYSLEDWIYYNS